MVDAVREQQTVAQAIRERLGPSPAPGAYKRAAGAIGVEPARLSNWVNLDQEPEGEALEGLRQWLGLSSVYDLGPYIVATKLARAERRGKLR